MPKHIGIDIHLNEDDRFTFDTGTFPAPSAFHTFEVMTGNTVVRYYISGGESAPLYDAAATFQRLSNRIFEMAREANEREFEEFRAEAEARETEHLAIVREWNELHQD